MNILLKIFYVSIALIASSSVFADQIDIGAAVKEISSAPNWTGMDEVKITIEGPKIIQILEKYVDLPLQDARGLLRQLLDSGGEFDLDIAGKVYIFNRLYCNVPASIKRDGWKFFGGWAGVPITASSVNSLYPLSVKNDSQLELKSVFSGYAGPPYRGLEELDYFIERFGRRADPSKK